MREVPVSPAREIINEARDTNSLKLTAERHQHEITNKAKSRYNRFKLPLVNI